ncbi:armadillo-type protein [Naematelia encephala]|uniref:Serine/threonine-protein kinase TOR n=1 Tax=Naematelia encephala TaxID=71784 RepID=A0A1Y2B2T9_9TREE|nr:armadillo-type protein [Naematelia encephala]
MTSQSEVLDTIFYNLRNRSEEVRERAANDLRNYVTAATADHPLHDGAKNVWGDVFQRMFELTRSNNQYDRLGAVASIERMLEWSNEDAPDRAVQKNLRLFEYLRPLLTCTDSTVMVAASKVVGTMVAIAGNILGDSFFNKEIDRARQMLEDTRQDVSRFAGVLILSSFAHNAPGLFHPHIPRVLDKIWLPLRDSRSLVRERASLLLSDCLDILKTREKTPNDIYRKIFEEARSGLRKASSTESILGSLLAFGAMLRNQQISMAEYYRPMCDLTLKFRDSKDVAVRKAVITLFPAMATYDSDEFEQNYLHRIMAYLMQALGKPTDRDIAYVSIGHMALQLASKMRPFIDDIIKIIKDHLRQRGKKNAPNESTIFQCLAMLTSAVGPMLTRQMHEVLDLMFPWGLSDSLYKALRTIAEHIPPLLRTIQERLLDSLSMILLGQPFRPLGAPSPPGAPTSTRDLNLLQASPGGPSPDLVALALMILGSFDFTGHKLNEFVREAALPYLENDSFEVRRAAVLAATKLFINDPICSQTSTHSIEIVSDVLEKLLTVGITDPNPNIRRTVLENLDAKFDRHLAQAEDIRCLFIALNDEVFHNRELAIGIIGRLAEHNPAYVMPPLRKSLINLITELEYSTNTRQKEESAKLLCLLIGAAASLVKSYAPTILTVLLRTAGSPETSIPVAACCVTCIGELARVAGEELVSSADSILKLVIDMLSDQTSNLKRDAALKTLGQIASNSGQVIAPYLDHPQLLGILFRFLRTETSQAIRLETIRTMGMLGALDPFKHKLLQGNDETNTDTSGQRVTDITILMNTQTPSNDEYYQKVVISSLVSVLRDAALKEYHYEAVEAVMLIFRAQRFRCVSFLPQILPAFLHVVRIAGPQRQDVYLKQLANLITIVKQHIRNYLGDIFALVHEFWEHDSKGQTQVTLIQLVEAVARAVEGEFKAYLPRLLQQILRSFDGDLTAKHLGERRLATLLHILRAFYVFGSSIEDYLHLVLPVIVRSFEDPSAPEELRKAALRTTGQLCRKVNFSDHASQIIHPLVRTLGNSDSELRSIAMDTLCVLVLQFGPDYAIFIPMVNKVLVEHRIVHPAYDTLVTKLLNRERLPPDLGPVEYFDSDPTTEASASAEQSKLAVNQQQLKAAWDCSNVTSKVEWLDWIKRLGSDLMKESPSAAIRASTSLAMAHAPVARDLFNVAFVSCWTELYESYQEDLVHNLELALTNSQIPPDVVNMILNLAEFMEHDDKALAIEARLLGDYAAAFHYYAKALHYKEMEFFVDASNSVVEDLISINQKLQQTDAAWGTLEYAQGNMEMSSDVQWFEKLGKWELALQVWGERELNEDPGWSEAEIAQGKLRCLHALGEWEHLSELAQVHWASASQEDKKKMAPLAAAASWSRNQWDLMDDYIAAMKNDSADRNFFKAIIAVHRNQFTTALRHIAKARERLDPELTSLTSESYGRAYDVVVRVQMLAELEEIIGYKEQADQPERQLMQRKTWAKRLNGCQRDVEVWQRMLQVRAMVLNPNEDMDVWIQFADLCRVSDRLPLAEKTLNSLVGTTDPHNPEERSRAPPPVIFAVFRLAWAKTINLEPEDQIAERNRTLAFLSEFAENLSDDIGLHRDSNTGRLVLPADSSFDEFTRLLARCHVELGQWQTTLKDGDMGDDPSTILQNYSIATELDSTWYHAWHTWALANFQVITQLEISQDGLAGEHFTTYIIPAVEGFLRSIALSPGNSLQDTLRLLTLWFTYGYQQGVSAAISQGLPSVNIDVWLEVIPQIIARIHTPRQTIQGLLVRLLYDIGRAHPQALVYPLTVASKSNVESRRVVAQSITAKMREQNAKIVDQAELISTELIRAAILWHEIWYDGLEEASKHYFADQNVEGMFETLEPLHEMVEAGPETIRETSFVQSFGHDLSIARGHLRIFKNTNENKEIQAAWDIYYSVFQRLGKQLKLLNIIELQYVSPKLMAVRDLDIAVPGTYQSGKPVVGIRVVMPTFTVITSKQRPRKFTMIGRDDKEYVYCLKGHEDLRQDERVMQLFGLVNTLLNADQECAKRHLSIQQYSITPLSPNAGLLGWVQHSDTLHMLIKNYRESRKILVDIEHRLMQQMADESYDSLPLLHKVEVFQYALDNTTGQDLYRILWLKSRNSENWLERRVTYTRSLGVNSMIGYILGLGDRHPSNLLLDQVSGKIVHIDFGDCFEVAQQRDKYPEKVPFRLTRMLIHAMEVCGITGTFSRSCEVSMEVLRDNRESLMAVLETFVYDPLLNWRLTATNQPGGRVGDNQELDEAQGARQRKSKANETEILHDVDRAEVKNDKALQVIDRVRRKLTGRDFKPDQVLDVKMQVEKLVDEATKTENLCVAFLGWCSFW